MSEDLTYRKGFQEWPDFVEIHRLGKVGGITMFTTTIANVKDDGTVYNDKEYTTEVQLVDKTDEEMVFRVYLLNTDFSRSVLCGFSIKMDDVDEMWKKMTEEGYKVKLRDVLQDHYETILHTTIIMYAARCPYTWAMHLYYSCLQNQRDVAEYQEELAKENKKPTVH